MEAKSLHGRQIAHRSVSDVAYAVQGLPYIGVNLAHEGPDSRHMVDILQHNYPRLGNGSNVAPKIHAVVVASARHRRARTPDSSGYCVTQHRLEVWKTATHGSGNKTFVPQPDNEPFNRIRRRTSVQGTDPIQIEAWKGQHT